MHISNSLNCTVSLFRLSKNHFLYLLSIFYEKMENFRNVEVRFSSSSSSSSSSSYLFIYFFALAQSNFKDNAS